MRSFNQQSVIFPCFKRFDWLINELGCPPLKNGSSYLLAPKIVNLQEGKFDVAIYLE